MDTNINPWDYYKPGFVDPLYQSYQNKNINYPNANMCGGRSLSISKSEIGKQYGGNPCIVTDNTTKRTGCGTLALHPELIKENWGQTFKRMRSSDPCPAGWVKGSQRGDKDYMCYREIDSDTLGGRTYNFYNPRGESDVQKREGVRSGINLMNLTPKPPVPEVNAYGRVRASSKNPKRFVACPQRDNLIAGMSNRN